MKADEIVLISFARDGKPWNVVAVVRSDRCPDGLAEFYDIDRCDKCRALVQRMSGFGGDPYVEANAVSYWAAAGQQVKDYGVPRRRRPRRSVFEQIADLPEDEGDPFDDSMRCPDCA